LRHLHLNEMVREDRSPGNQPRRDNGSYAPELGLEQYDSIQSIPTYRPGGNYLDTFTQRRKFDSTEVLVRNPDQVLPFAQVWYRLTDEPPTLAGPAPGPGPSPSAADPAAPARLAQPGPVAEAGAGRRHPLVGDAIPRDGSRLVLDQGPMPTCGANSCSMVLDTLGRPTDVATLIERIPPRPGGITAYEVRELLRSEGVGASVFRRRNVNDLARYTEGGHPVVVRIFDESSGFSHFVVVDGVTTRHGRPAVAIRDPHDMQYFSPADTFSKYFSGEVVVPVRNRT
jgi:hypothetical protein